ncbi:DUF5719 family protein [Cryobacterium fucosi]|uniref:Large extracellular alpha-helical protein n=1 Tax=Cryobacterium fucosi TaxID=1259157 RepID=A0A4R9BEU2_9MICO|nr:DUF5719 family protein [Cryobacterium fucosi]TFD82652.1 hypothetical protein E3T48_01495 [Cryobacterium fucosi]
MPSRRGMALLGARALAGTAVLAVAVGVVGAAAVVPWPTLETSPPSVLVSPVPTEQQRVCPGPLLTLAEDSTQAQAATSVGPADAAFGAHAASAGSDWIRPSSTELAAPDNGKSDVDGAPRLLRVDVQDGATTAPLVAASQSQTAAAESLAGLAVAACAEAVSEAWLVGGSTDVGRTSLVLLSNPSTVVATVDLTVYGEAGPVNAPGSTGILVQPGSQRIVSLAGLAPNLRSPVVYVSSHGGQVAASLQQSVVRGIEPGGVDILGSSAGPGRTQRIAGLLVTTQAAPAATDSSGVADDIPSVRILVPGDTAATVQLGVVSESGQQVGIESEEGKPAGSSVQVEVQPGIATDVPLTGLAPGAYSVELSSDRPIVAAAQAPSAGTAGKDFAWFAASGTLADDFLVAVAPGPGPALHLVNTSDDDATYTATPETGPPIEVTVPAGKSGTLPLAASARYLVSGGRTTIASVGYSGAGMVSSFALSQAGPLAAPIQVYPH